MQHETVIASRSIYEGRIINLRVDEVRTPGALETVREIVEHPGAVALVATGRDGRVLLVKQYRHAVGRVTTEIPAGTLKPGEDPLACAERELIEETGYSAARIQRIGAIHPSPGFCTEYIHLFAAHDLSAGDAHPDADEHIEVEWIPWEEALRRVTSAQIDDAKSVCGLLLADRLRAGS